jgi:hypothetical protein
MMKTATPAHEFTTQDFLGLQAVAHEFDRLVRGFSIDPFDERNGTVHLNLVDVERLKVSFSPPPSSSFRVPPLNTPHRCSEPRRTFAKLTRLRGN